MSTLDLLLSRKFGSRKCSFEMKWKFNAPQILCRPTGFGNVLYSNTYQGVSLCKCELFIIQQRGFELSRRMCGVFCVVTATSTGFTAKL